MKRFLASVLMMFAVVSPIVMAQVPDFIAPASYSTGGSAAHIAVGDLNGDGRPDIVTVENATQSLSILLANPDGTYQSPLSRGLGFSASSIVAADFNGDGVADLALSAGNFIAVLINAGDGTFAPPAFYSAGISANYVTAADVNHDGKLDLAVAGGFGCSVLRGLGTGAFTAPVVLPDTFSHSWLVLGDFNNDGNIDLLADGGQGKFYAGNGDGTFAAPVLTVIVPYGAVAADLNADGKLDIASVVTTFSRELVASENVAVAIGTGNGQFLSYMNFVYGGASAGQVAVGDFNGDGIADLAIYINSPAQLQVLAGGSLQFPGITADPGTAANTVMIAADVDGNGSRDLLLMSAGAVTVIRDTHGNPPLLAFAALSPAAVVGGANSQGTVMLGGPAPAGGAIAALSSNNSNVAYPVSATVTIPEGLPSATFPIQTVGVPSANPVNFSAQWNSVTQNATLTVVAPYAITGLAISPASQYGIFTAQGTVTLSGPADSAAVVSLSSSNAALAAVPASVTVPAGATSANFTILLQPVTADTSVSLSAALGGTSQSASMTILHPLDAVKITRAEDVVSKFQLRVEATSTSAVTTMTAWNAATGAFIGTLANAGGGKYTGQFTVPQVLSITIKSSLGGFATGPVVQK